MKKILLITLFVSSLDLVAQNIYPSIGSVTVKQPQGSNVAYDGINSNDIVVTRMEVSKDLNGQMWLKDSNGDVKIYLKGNDTFPSSIVGELVLGEFAIAPKGKQFFVKGDSQFTGIVGIGVDNTSARGKLQIAGLPNANYTFIDGNDRWEKSLVLNIGSLVNGTSGSGNRLLTFSDWPVSNLNSKARTWFGIEDRNDNNRLRHWADTDGYSSFHLSDKAQQEFFKVFEVGDNDVAMQLGKSNSRFIIGGYTDYPNSLGHKLFVQAGSAKVEGNILTDSNIGIGTSTFVDGADTYRLSVKGKMRAEEVKVYTTWADYVFDKEYKLPSLEEVEKHIKENGHLINVPSGREIEEKGLFVGEMTKIQQEKIEELTLYLIQQKKEIEELKAQMKLLLEKSKL